MVASSRSHCPRLPRPSTAWLIASVTVWVAFSVNSLITLPPDSWAFFRASVMTVGKRKKIAGASNLVLPAGEAWG